MPEPSFLPHAPAARAAPAGRQSVAVAVVMERVRAPNAWEDWGFRALEVLPDPGVDAAPRLLRDDGQRAHWLHGGFDVTLYADECKGYYLNLSSGRPVWFVFWRVAEDDPARAEPVQVSVSYIEADRWMSAGERVDTLPMPEDGITWLRDFTQANFVPDAPRRQRAQSFLSPEERARGAAAVAQPDGAALASTPAEGGSDGR